MIEAFSLFSGSAGNASLIRSGNTALLIDAGRSRRAIACGLASAGMGLCDIHAVFITHEHTDHVSALPQLSKHEGMPIHASAGTADALSGLGSLIRHPVIYTESVGSLTVQAFPLPHDSACHVGYVITDTDGDAFLVATDMGHITEDVQAALTGCRGALLESNHDVNMLRRGPYPAYLKTRILSPRGHLSNTDCASLARLAEAAGVRHIALGHLSEENNTPKLAYDTVAAALSGKSRLIVCDRCTPTRIM